MKVREFTKEESPYIASSISQEIWQSAANYGYAEACKDHQELVDACKDALSDFKFIEKVSPEINFKATILKLEHVLAKYKGE